MRNRLLFCLSSILACLSGFAAIPAALATPPIPVPFLIGISPVSTVPGGPDLSLTVRGANFLPASVIYWGETPLPTVSGASTTLVATVPAALVAAPGVGRITVRNPGNAVNSNVLFLPVAQPTANVQYVQSSLPAVNSPLQLLQADLNGDGNLDIVVGNNGADTIGVFLGNGDGTFQAEQTFAVDFLPEGIAAGDLNGDGKLDLVVGHDLNGNESLSVLLGNGDGTFQAFVPVGVPGQITSVPSLADFNGDGNLDIIVSDFVTPSVYVLLGNGDGTFQAAQTINVPVMGWNISISDFNEDGILDFAIAGNGTQNSSVYVSIGIGDGTFAPAQTFPAATNPYFIRSADMNGDGHADLVVSSESSSGAILLGNGDGTFQAPRVAPSQFSFTVDVADLNADGHLDIAGDADSPIVFLGNGDGTLQPGQYLSDSTDSFASIVGAFANGGALGLAATDYVNNSLLLLLPTISVSPSSLVFAAQGVGSSSPAQAVTVANPTASALNISAITFTDVNAGDFAQTSDCGTVLPPGATCTIGVVFSPTAAGTRVATLNLIDDGANSPQTVGITAAAVDASFAILSPATVDFGPQLVSSPGAQQVVTLENPGNLALSISGVTIAGVNGADFTQTSTCGVSLAPASSCSINVSFLPSAAGSRAATLSVATSASVAPATVVLEGTGQDFSISMPASQTVSAGNSAVFELTVTPLGGFNRPIGFTCSGAPALAHCSIAPPSATPDGSTASTVAVTLATTASSVLAPARFEREHQGPRATFPGPLLLVSAALVMLLLQFQSSSKGRTTRHSRLLEAGVLLIFVSLAVAACGGGSSRTRSGGTPAGTYTITVTATSGALTHSSSAQLTVQ